MYLAFDVTEDRHWRWTLPLSVTLLMAGTYAVQQSSGQFEVIDNSAPGILIGIVLGATLALPILRRETTKLRARQVPPKERRRLLTLVILNTLVMGLAVFKIELMVRNETMLNSLGSLLTTLNIAIGFLIGIVTIFCLSLARKTREDEGAVSH